jgi:hypothetical protein
VILKQLRKRKGSSPIWTIVIAVVLISFSLLIYTGMALQSNYRQAQMEIERAAHVSLNINLENKNVRDIAMGADLASVKQSLESNLIQIGYEKEDDHTWHRIHQDKIMYTLDDLILSSEGERIYLRGKLTSSLLWGS